MWMYINDAWVSLGGRAPLTRIFMRGSAPQTPHRFNGYTPPHRYMDIWIYGCIKTMEFGVCLLVCPPDHIYPGNSGSGVKKKV